MEAEIFWSLVIIEGKLRKFEMPKCDTFWILWNVSLSGGLKRESNPKCCPRVFASPCWCVWENADTQLWVTSVRKRKRLKIKGWVGNQVLVNLNKLICLLEILVNLIKLICLLVILVNCNKLLCLLEILINLNKLIWLLKILVNLNKLIWLLELLQKLQ